MATSEVAAKEPDVDAVVCDTTDPTSLYLRHVTAPNTDTIVSLPALSWGMLVDRALTKSDTVANVMQ